MALPELSGPSGSPHDAGHIRVATVSDIPFILEVAERAYGFDNDVLGSGWLKKVILDKNNLVLVGKHSAGIATFARIFYWRKPRGYILQVVSTPKGLSREALRLMQRLVAWLKERGCSEVLLGSEIGTDYAPFARILGATPSAPSYVIRFREMELANA